MQIELAPKLRFEAAEIATEVVASLGARGGGKSNGAAVMVECLLDAGVPVIVVDYVGIWFSLRLSPDGKTPSRFKIPVLGGPHGDVALAPGAGAVVAEALAERHSSAVLDLSSFSKQDRMRFFTDFAEAFFRAKKRHPGPVQLLLEESQRFCPQRVQPDQARMLGAVEEIAEVGRNYGIGLHLISQRPQKINKDVLNLADTVIGYRTLGVLERKAIGEWVQEKDVAGRDEVQNELPSLRRGRAIVWSPSRQIFGQFDIIKKSTYDAGATPVHARADVATTPLDLGELEKAMGRAVEEAEKNNPAKLRAEISRLQAELIQRPIAKPAKTTIISEIPKSVQEQAHRLELLIEDHQIKLVEMLEKARVLYEKSRDLHRAMMKRSEQSVSSSHASPVITAVYEPRQVKTSSDDESRKLSKCARALLQVLAQRRTATLSQLAILSGYSRKSSGFANSVSELRVGGFAQGSHGRLEVTPYGSAEAGDVLEELPKGHALLGYWMRKLGKCEAKLLEEIYGNGVISRSTLAEVSGYSERSSGFANALSTLRTLELISGSHGENLKISDVFEEG